ncbi:hypothetical protein K7432_011329 [Basidiobolus ranarum]|uniref:Uncharacterized protein n=1 Tax=Basidiobolus ranarum TaxID=34480 RepID=A0ABR2VU35_9FUNG
MGSSPPSPLPPYYNLVVPQEKNLQLPSPLYPYSLSPLDPTQETPNTESKDYFTHSTSESTKTTYNSPPLPPRPTRSSQGSIDSYKERYISYNDHAKLTNDSATHYSNIPPEESQDTSRKDSTLSRRSKITGHRRPVPQLPPRSLNSKCSSDASPSTVYKTIPQGNHSIPEHRNSPLYKRPVPAIPTVRSVSLDTQQAQNISSTQSDLTAYNHPCSDKVEDSTPKASPSLVYDTLNSRKPRHEERVHQPSNIRPQLQPGPSAKPLANGIGTQRHSSLLLKSHLNAKMRPHTYRKVSLPELSQHPYNKVDINGWSPERENASWNEAKKSSNGLEPEPISNEIKEAFTSAESSPTSTTCSTPQITPAFVGNLETIKDVDSDMNLTTHLRHLISMDNVSLASDMSSDEFSLATSLCDKEFKDLDETSSIHAENTILHDQENDEASIISQDSIKSDDVYKASRSSSFSSLSRESESSREPRKSYETISENVRNPFSDPISFMFILTVLLRNSQDAG